MSDESFEVRDIGPYESVVQVMRQFANWSHGLPQPHSSGPLLVAEAALLAGVSLTDFEREYLHIHGVDPILATIIQGAIIRAHLGGYRTGSVTPDPRPAESSDTSGQSSTPPPA